MFLTTSSAYTNINNIIQEGAACVALAKAYPPLMKAGNDNIDAHSKLTYTRDAI